MNRRPPVHVSWHITAASTGVLIGAVAALLPQVRMMAAPAWLVLGLLLTGLAGLKRTRQALVLAIIGGILAGMWRGTGEQLQLARYRPYYNQTVAVQGKVVEDATSSTSNQQQFRLSAVTVNQTQLHGQIWVSTHTPSTFKRSDIVSLRGKLSHGFGTLPAAVNYAQILSVKPPQSPDTGGRLRNWFGKQVRVSVPEPQASLGIGYTLGQSQGLPDSIKQQFQLLGLTHLLVASGSQLTLLVRFARRPLSKRSKYLAIVTSLSLVGGFLLLTGFTPSMIRAALVAGLSLLAWYYGRIIHPVVLLCFVAAITVLMQPSFIWGDVGWLLSFAAFGGVIVLGPLLHHYFWGQGEPGFLRYVLISTTAAQIMTLPIALYAFGEYSPLSLLANMLTLPLVGLAMLFTFLGGLTTALIPAIAHLAGLPAYITLTYMTFITNKLAAIPGAHGTFTLTRGLLAASYVVIFTVMSLLWWRTKYRFQQIEQVV